MEHPQLAMYKGENTPSTLSLRFENDFKHGFLSIEGKSVISGSLVELLDNMGKEFKFTMPNNDEPFVTFTTEADFSLSSHYQLKAHLATQAFEFYLPNDEGEAVKFESTPMQFHVVLTPETAEGSYAIDRWSMYEGGAIVSAENVGLTFSGNLWFSPVLDKMLWQEQLGQLKIDKVTLNSGGNSATVAEQIAVDSVVTTDEQQRGQLGIRYQVKKFALPDLPMSNIEDLDVNIVGEAGVKAALEYYEQIQSMQTNPDDPQQGLALFAKLLTEDINFTIETFKAKTFAGPIDLIANMDFKGLDAAEFEQNPMLAMANLSYKASGELPQDLIAMSGQLPPELIDNLVQQQMLEVKDGQVHFTLDGSAGSVNLNGKPLM